MKRNIPKTLLYKGVTKQLSLIESFFLPFILLCSSVAIAHNNTVSGTVADVQTGETLLGGIFGGRNKYGYWIKGLKECTFCLQTNQINRKN